jgi:hypothetical protein
MKKTYFSKLKGYVRLGLLAAGLVYSMSAFSGDITTGLLLQYSFDELNSSSTTVADNSGKGNVGTLQGAPTITDGYSGQAIDFGTAKANYVKLPANINSTFSSFTYTTWVKVTALKNATRFFDLGSGADATNNFLAFVPSYGADNGFMVLRYRPASGTAYNVTSTSKLPVNTWAHVAVTFDGTTKAVTMYLNGAAVGTGTIPGLDPTSMLGTAGATSDNYLAISRWAQDANGFNGALDDVRFYNRALTSSDILMLTGLAELNKQTATLNNKMLTAEDSSAITSNLTLPTTLGTNGVTVKWASSNNAAIDTFGVVTRPQTYNAPVKLTATLSQEVGGKTYSMTKSFLFIVSSIAETPFYMARWKFDSNDITTENGVVKVKDQYSGFVGTVKNDASIRTIGNPGSAQFNVLYLGNGTGYLDMGTEIGKAIYSLTDYTMCGYFRIDDDYASINSNGNFYWTFSNTDSAMTKSTGYIIGSLKAESQSVASNRYDNGNQATGANVNAGLGKWHHFAYTQSGNTGTVYIDGVQVAQNTSMTNLPATTLPKTGLTGTLYNWLGRSNYVADAYLRKTMLYDFQLLNGPLTADDISVSGWNAGEEGVITTIGNLEAAYAQNPNYVNTDLNDEFTNLTFAKLTSEDSTQVTANLTLPTVGLLHNNIAITWTSSNTKVIDATGVVIRPDYYGATVTLTATLAFNGQKVSKTFHPTVLVKPGTQFTNDLLVKYDFANVTNDTIVTDAAEKHFTGVVKNTNYAGIRTIGTAETGTYKVLALGDSIGYFDMGAEVGKLMYHLNDYTMSAYYRIDDTYTNLTKAGNFIWNFSNSKDILTTPTGYVIASLKSQVQTISPTNWSSEQSVNYANIALTGSWHNFTYTQSGTTGTVYIDGMPLTSGTVTSLPSATLFKDGALGTLYNWIGRSCYATDAYLRKTMVYDFRLYRKALSLEEIMTTDLNVGNTITALDAAYLANHAATAVNQVKASQYQVIASVGSIRIVGLVGGEKVSVFDVTGRQFQVTNPSEIAVTPGMYIVKVNGYVTKVVVK